MEILSTIMYAYKFVNTFKLFWLKKLWVLPTQKLSIEAIGKKDVWKTTQSVQGISGCGSLPLTRRRNALLSRTAYAQRKRGSVKTSAGNRSGFLAKTVLVMLRYSSSIFSRKNLDIFLIRLPDQGLLLNAAMDWLLAAFQLGQISPYNIIILSDPTRNACLCGKWGSFLCIIKLNR